MDVLRRFEKCDVIILSADFGSGHHQVSLPWKSSKGAPSLLGGWNI